MTTIEWVKNADGTAGRTWNPVTGCDRTSPGCDRCYAMVLAARLKLMGSPKYQNDGDSRTSGPGFAVTCHPATLNEPLRRRVPTTWFVNSMSDLFHKDVPETFIRSVWRTMATAEQHTFQVLTKRPQRAVGVLANSPVLPNVWLGTSIESDRYCFRAERLRATPAAVRFLSCEPLLGPLNLNLDGIDWVIAGAESGRGARPMNPDWVRDIRDRCVDAAVPFFFKQRLDEHGHKVPIPELDGRTWNEMPATKGQIT